MSSALSSRGGKRFVETVIAATRFGPRDIPGKEHFRIIGTTDVDGKGTTHGLHSLDPFLFLDESLNPPGMAGLGGGGHPHAGLTAITYLSPSLPPLGSSAGGRLQPWDNFRGAQQPANNAGGVYVLSAGRGAVHDERNITENGVMHQFQLWVDPGAEGRKAAAAVSLHPPQDIPVVTGPALGPTAGSAWCRIMIGKQFGETSPVASPIDGGMLYLHLSLPATGETSIEIPDHFRGLVYILDGEALVGATKVRLSKRQAAVLSANSNENGLYISNPDESDNVQLLIAAGAPQHSGPLFKFLGNGGAVFATSENSARECMKRFEADPSNFGKK